MSVGTSGVLPQYPLRVLRYIVFVNRPWNGSYLRILILDGFVFLCSGYARKVIVHFLYHRKVFGLVSVDLSLIPEYLSGFLKTVFFFFLS